MDWINMARNLSQSDSSVIVSRGGKRGSVSQQQMNSIMTKTKTFLVLFGFLRLIAYAQQPQLSQQVRNFVKVDAPVIALTNARVIDGTGAPAREKQTIIIIGGKITALGDASR